MAKVKLSIKDKKNTTYKEEPWGGMFYRYQCPKMTGIVITILEVLSLILTSIFALCAGLLVPLTNWLGQMELEIEDHPVFVVWFIASIVYVIGTFILILGKPRIAAIVHTVAMAGSLVMYYMFLMLNNQYGAEYNSGPTVLYMPCIFITIISVIVVMLIYIPKWLEKKAEKDREQAPSILADDKED